MLRRIAGAAAAGSIVGMLLFVAPAGAQYVGGQTPNVGGADGGAVVLGTRGSNQPVVLGARGSNSSRLALSGGDIAQLSLLAGASVGAGAVAVRAARRRKAEPVPSDS